MKLKKIHLSNFCQHRNLEVEFPPGIVGILGGNGQGKSNLIKAIRFALIGESGNVGVKTEDLNWHAAAEGEPGFVELTFEEGGETGVVKRYVSSTRTSLKHSHNSTTSSNKATAAILEISGVTRGTYESIIFVNQGEIETVLFEKPAERAKKFQRLFGTEGAERLRQLLHQEYATLTTDPVDGRIAELEQQLAVEIDPQLRELDSKKREAESIIEAADENSLRRIIKAFELSRAAKQQLDDLLQQKKKCEQGVDPQILEKLTQAVTNLASEVEAKRVTVNAARARLANVEQTHALIDTKKRLKEEIKEYTERLQQEPPKPPKITKDQFEDSQKQLDMARAEVARHMHFISTFEQGRPLCPTCNQPVVNALARVEESKTLVDARNALIEQVESVLLRAREELSYHRAQLLAYEAEIESCRRLIASRTEELGKLPETPKTRGDEEALKQQVDSFEMLESHLDKRTEELNALKEKGAKSSGELASIDRQIEHTKKQIDESITDDKHVEAKQTLEYTETVRMGLAETVGQLKQLQAARVRILAELEGLRVQAGSLEAKRKYKVLCERTRELLHRGVLPQRVTQRYLSILNASLQTHIERFDVPFGCRIDDGLNVICTIPGIGEKSADRLSGGQKVMLGIAFRFAICRLFAAGLGFVVLDEPTVMLDNDHVDIVAEMLNNIKGHALNAGLQLIVVTHSLPLASTFDSVIRL